MEKRPVRKLRVSGEKGDLRLSVLFDSGSTWGAIREDFVRKIDTPRKFKTTVPFHMAAEDMTVEVREWVVLEVWLFGKPMSGLFAVVRKLKSEALVGAEFMDSWDIHLHMRGGRVSVGVGDENGRP